MSPTYAILAAVLLTACASTPTTVSPPTAPSATILALDAIEISCAAAVPNVSAAAAGWLATCPTVVTTTIDAVEATPATAVTTITSGLVQFLAIAPKTGLTQQDTQIIASIAAAVNAFMVLYQQQAAISGRALVIPAAFQAPAPAKHPLTAADRKQLETTRKHAAATAKKMAKGGAWWKKHSPPGHA